MKIASMLRSGGYATLAALFGARVTTSLERRFTGHNAMTRRALMAHRAALAHRMALAHAQRRGRRASCA